MLQDNKKLLAVYAVWAFIHLYLWLTSGGYLFDPSGSQTDVFYPFANEYSYEAFKKRYYDYSELFVYLAAPLLIWYLYKTFKK
jgi:hypothetical protein